MSRAWLVVVVAGTATALGACGNGESFADRDPRGYEACSEWAGYVSEGGAEAVVGGGMAVAEIARQSSTEAIRDSVSNLFDEDTAAAAGDQFGLLDVDKFEAACEQEGFEFD